MPTIAFRFPGGRYHATPWGHHVNEGLVEWPPSPWRLVRALLATGFTKLGWREPPPSARELVDGLSGALPEYWLPHASAAHTRHWMPTDSKTPKGVIDAFAHVGKEGELAVVWPATLSAGAHALLRDLVPKISYLGRAESTVVARLVDDAHGLGGLRVTAEATNRPGYEPIALLAPLTQGEYETWRRACSEHEREEGKRKGRNDPYPPDAFAAALVDTGFLQEHGWTQPPGTRRVHYYRPSLTTSRRLASSPRVSPDALERRALPDSALLALASNARTREVLPLFERSLPAMELLHAALVSLIGDAGCPELTGRDEAGARLVGHKHAFLIPLDLDDDGRLDHVLVHARMGLGRAAQHALRSLRRTYAKGTDPLFVTLAGLGTAAEFARVGLNRLPQVASSKVWRSVTPFVPPRHLKSRRNSLADQVRAELASRGLPNAVRIEAFDHDLLVRAGFHQFVRMRRDRSRRPPAPRFFGLHIELEADASGPIALGYGSHFGLGVLVADNETDLHSAQQSALRGSIMGAESS